MGSCLGGQRQRRSSSGEGNENRSNAASGGGGSVGKNCSLRKEKIKWKSDVPLTEGQLRSKRDEFWDTAPAFDGRKEIWDALRAAAQAAEQSDYVLAQAILDGANITLPHGMLTECYDELGARYQLPIYCLSSPTNMADEASASEGGGRDDLDSKNGGGGAGVTLKLRPSSTGRDLHLKVSTTDHILTCKKALQLQEPSVGDASKQRWFFGGRLLQDKVRIEEARVPTGFVIQVVVADTSQPTPVN